MSATTYGRPKNQDRVTPFYDCWRSNLERALTERGARTRLALFLAHDDKTKVNRWRAAIWKTLSANAVPDGEFVLAVNAWLQKEKGTVAKHR